jgi:hypothetical protein
MRSLIYFCRENKIQNLNKIKFVLYTRGREERKKQQFRELNRYMPCSALCCGEYIAASDAIFITQGKI